VIYLTFVVRLVLKNSFSNSRSYLYFNVIAFSGISSSTFKLCSWLSFSTISGFSKYYAEIFLLRATLLGNPICFYDKLFRLELDALITY